MSPSLSSAKLLWPALAWVLGGLGLALGAWMLPVNMNALPPALVEEAGGRAASTTQLGEILLEREKLGPAALVHQAAVAVVAPDADALGARLEQARELQPELVPWGGWDPFLEPLVAAAPDTDVSTPVLRFFVTRDARETLAGFLSNSRSTGVRTLLRLREIDRAVQFVPATRPGGQVLDATVLLAALLYQGEHLSDSLQQEVRVLAENALATNDLARVEPFLLDLLSLGKRLDWTQLTELTRLIDGTETIAEFAHLSRLAADDLAMIYTAALAADAADPVANYLIRFGRQGLEDLEFALRAGQGAVQQLLVRQVPINRDAGPSFGGIAALALLHPGVLLGCKYVGLLIGAFLVFRGVDRFFIARTNQGALPHLSSGVLAVFAAGLVVLATEPFLLQAAPASEFKLSFAVPVLADIADGASIEPTQPTSAMDSSTLLSIGFFAALQVAMYLICLLKIAEINKREVAPLVKLKLMENEENLFDGGLYVGIGGTATALVLQVLGVIDPNLLAAYSSNLFGITCVALVKIRHVRPYKCKLILESEDLLTRADIKSM
jgi:hypothetical protein